MNLVVITAALSSANTNLYLSTRMLFSLARGRYAPTWLGQLSAAGVPRAALAVSTAGMVAAVFLAIYAPQRAFLLLYGTAVAGMFFVWLVGSHHSLTLPQGVGDWAHNTAPLAVALAPISDLARYSVSARHRG